MMPRIWHSCHGVISREELSVWCVTVSTAQTYYASVMNPCKMLHGGATKLYGFHLQHNLVVIILRSKHSSPHSLGEARETPHKQAQSWNKNTSQQGCNPSRVKALHNLDDLCGKKTTLSLTQIIAVLSWVQNQAGVYGSIGSMCKYCVGGGILLYLTLTAADKMRAVSVLVSSLHAAVLSLIYGVYFSHNMGGWSWASSGKKSPSYWRYQKTTVVLEAHLHSKKCINKFTFTNNINSFFVPIIYY